MKKILLVLFVLIGFSAAAQVLQAPNVYGYQFRRVGGDTLLFIPGDTLQVPATYNSKTFVARKGTSLYYWNGSSWAAITGAGGYTSGAVDSIWRVPGKDSIFWLKNGTTYKFKDSTGVASNIYTANGTMTGNRTVSTSTYDFNVYGQSQGVFLTMSPTLIGGYVSLGVNAGTSTGRSAFVGADSAKAIVRASSSSPSSTANLHVFPDSVLISTSSSGKLNIPFLRTTTDTATYKPVVWGDGGQVRRLTSWPVPSGGITSLNSQTGATQTFSTGRGISVSSSSNVHTFSLQNDTTTLAVFGAGSGAAGDTAAFTTDALYGSFYIDVDTFIVTKIVAVIQAGATDTLGIQIYYNDSLNTGTVGVATSTLALTSRPQGHSTTTLSNATIPPGNFIWCKSPTVVAGRKPEYLSVSLIGYRKRRS